MLGKIRAKNFSESPEGVLVSTGGPKYGGDLVSWINKVSPFELHLPGHNYTGPGTNLLLNMEKGKRPINSVDNAALFHDISYHESKDLPTRHLADAELERKTSSIPTGEAFLVNSLMKVKRKLGLGLEEFEDELVNNFKNFLEFSETSAAHVPDKTQFPLSDRHRSFLRAYCDRVGDMKVLV